MYRFLTILILIAIGANAALAQTDIPLFDNLQSDDAERDDSRSQFLRSESESQTGGALRALERYYNAGKYPEALRISRYISDSLHLNRSETVQFLRYTIASYKELQYDEQADSAMMIFTKKTPFYDTTSYDPVAFKEEFDNFSVFPRLTLYADFSFRVRPFVDIKTVYPRADTSHTVPVYHYNRSTSGNIGLQFGITKKWALASSLGFHWINLSRTEDYDATSFYYQETDIFLDLSASVLYSFYKFKFRLPGLEITPILLAGGSVNCIGASSYKAYTWFGDNAQYAVSEQEADLDDKTAFNYTVFYGFRLNCFSFKRFNAYIEHSHHYMLLPLNNSANRYNNSDLLYNHLFVPDDIRLSFNQWTIGFALNLSYKTVSKYGYGYKK